MWHATEVNRVASVFHGFFLSISVCVIYCHVSVIQDKGALHTAQILPGTECLKPKPASKEALITSTLFLCISPRLPWEILRIVQILSVAKCQSQP